MHGPYSVSEATTYEADRAVEPLWHVENAYVETLLSRVGAASILDVPVGTGRFLPFYMTREVTGVDLSPAMLKEARGKLGTNVATISLIEGSITDLPFEQGKFDLVICWRLIHLLPPEMLDKVFQELRRVCHGTLCVQCYVQGSWWERYVAKTRRRIRRLLLPFRHKRHLTPWSHIRSWNHPMDLILSSAHRAGWGYPVRTELLGLYEGTRVLAVEWAHSQ